MKKKDNLRFSSFIIFNSFVRILLSLSNKEKEIAELRARLAELEGGEEKETEDEMLKFEFKEELLDDDCEACKL